MWAARKTINEAMEDIVASFEGGKGIEVVEEYSNTNDHFCKLLIVLLASHGMGREVYLLISKKHIENDRISGEVTYYSWLDNIVDVWPKKGAIFWVNEIIPQLTYIRF